MTREQFEASLTADEPPSGLSLPLAVLWWECRGAWAKAHAMVAPDEDSKEAAWVHAYLHRREGDIANAGYWYRRAGRTRPAMPLDAERDGLIAVLLANTTAG